MRTNTWTSGTPLPTVNGWGKAVGYQDSIIYLAGGYDGTNVLTNVKMYNSNSNSWREASPLPAGTIGAAFMRTGDTLVYVGGATLSAPVATTYVGVISQTNRSTITWTTGADYPAGAMYRFDGASWEPGQVIVGGGSPSTAWTPATPCPAYSYKPSTNTWTALPNLTTPVLGAFTGAVKYSNLYKFVLASGYTGAAASTGVQIYTDVLTGIINTSTEIPKEFSISQNYPNPFNPTTKINFALPKSGFVSLKIYDLLGREVATLVNEVKSAGQYTANFNASQFTSGVYFYKIESNGFSQVKKMMLIK
jgi:N-acetylneuraminic acid mutarotase